MRFTSHNCYQLCGSLLHCLFTLTNFFIGGNISVALSVILRSFAKKIYNYPNMPGNYPAFFPKEPGLYLIIISYHKDITMRSYPICTKLIFILVRIFFRIKIIIFVFIIRFFVIEFVFV